ncbi:hypothetical protein [Floricoccus penangensis]|uniref:hypothetical protein n=1 Tax=Floricoccus penangensis TaxID=1859475 RepID=UPI00203C1916|nr:hypothetical protein [Floricoccus penangensis]URZ87215.1 hypothetical protein KIW23_09045 [Floricoccus penangensis]
MTMDRVETANELGRIAYDSNTASNFIQIAMDYLEKINNHDNKYMALEFKRSYELIISVLSESKGITTDSTDKLREIELSL